MKTGPIFTELTACQDCYRCLRNCPVKAIRVKDGKAEVQKELCINCGRCLNECPAGAKKIRSDIGEVQQLLAIGKPVVVSLAPSWVTEFKMSLGLPNILLDIGFSAVEETAIGARLIADACKDEPVLARGISSACPVIVDHITRYEPELMMALSPLVSPLEAHARSIKTRYENGTSVVFIGPCVAKKLEADRADSAVDVALTFCEIQEWLDSPEKDKAESSGSEPAPIHSCEDFFLEGGFLRALEGSSGIEEGVALSSLDSVMPSLLSLKGKDRLELPPVELLACAGGCHNGPGTTRVYTPLEKRLQAEKSFKEIRQEAEPIVTAATMESFASKVESFLRDYVSEPGVRESSHGEDEIRAFLAGLGRPNHNDDPDCGSCGYHSCRNFAAAVLNDMAEESMCVSLMRRRAQSQSDALMSSLPLGAVIVDSEMSIRECNSHFLRLFTELDFDPPEEVLQRIRGRQLSKYMEDFGPVKRVVDGETDLFSGNLNNKGKVYRATVFPVGNEKMAGAVFQDITSPQVERETVIRKAEEVIQKNLTSVQQIASLLGENAAETQLILDSLIGAFDE